MIETASLRDGVVKRLEAALMTLGLDWTILVDLRIDAPPDRIAADYLLLHADYGVALVNLGSIRAPASVDATIIDAFRRFLYGRGFDTFFPGYLPIVRLTVTTQEVAIAGRLVLKAFADLPRLTIKDEAWAEAVGTVLTSASAESTAPEPSAPPPPSPTPEPPAEIAERIIAIAQSAGASTRSRSADRPVGRPAPESAGRDRTLSRPATPAARPSPENRRARPSAADSPRAATDDAVAKERPVAPIAPTPVADRFEPPGAAASSSYDAPRAMPDDRLRRAAAAPRPRADLGERRLAAEGAVAGEPRVSPTAPPPGTGHVEDAGSAAPAPNGSLCATANDRVLATAPVRSARLFGDGAKPVAVRPARPQPSRGATVVPALLARVRAIAAPRLRGLGERTRRLTRVVLTQAAAMTRQGAAAAKRHAAALAKPRALPRPARPPARPDAIPAKPDVDTRPSEQPASDTAARRHTAASAPPRRDDPARASPARRGVRALFRRRSTAAVAIRREPIDRPPAPASSENTAASPANVAPPSIAADPSQRNTPHATKPADAVARTEALHRWRRRAILCAACAACVAAFSRPLEPRRNAPDTAAQTVTSDTVPAVSRPPAPPSVPTAPMPAPPTATTPIATEPVASAAAPPTPPPSPTPLPTPSPPEPAPSATAPAPSAAPAAPSQEAAASPEIAATPPPPAVPDRARLNHDLALVLRNFGCSDLNAEIGADGTVTLTGFVSRPEDLARLTRDVSADPQVKRVDSRAGVTPWPFCELATLLGSRTQHGSGIPQIEASHADRVYRGGDALMVAVTPHAPATSYLYVDFFDSTGTVVHMLPTPLRTNNRVLANQRVMIGSAPARARRTDRIYVVAPPFGTGRLVAMSSSHPLFSRLRPEQESARTYLAALARALADDGTAVSSSEQPIMLVAR